MGRLMAKYTDMMMWALIPRPSSGASTKHLGHQRSGRRRWPTERALALEVLNATLSV